jgi:hypothetical protein
MLREVIIYPFEEKEAKHYHSPYLGGAFHYPLAFGLYELIPRDIWQVEFWEYNSWISGIITTSVRVGGFAMRYVVIYAGQVAQIITS